MVALPKGVTTSWELWLVNSHPAPGNDTFTTLVTYAF